MKASNGVSPDATQSYTINVTGTAPVITSTAVTNAAVGQAYSYDVNASGNPAPNYVTDNKANRNDNRHNNRDNQWTPTAVGNDTCNSKGT